jgi:hypothetical protein
MSTLVTVLVALVAFVSFVATQIVLVQLREHRTDLRPEQHFGHGRSQVWQFNALNRANYTEAGRKKLRWLYLLQVVWMLSALAVLTRFMGLW